MPTYQTPFDYSFWKDGRELKTESLSLTGSVLRAVEHTWANPLNNPQITQSVTTLADTNQVAKQTFLYDQYNNKTDVYEYAYGPGVSGSLVRRTHTDYVTTNVIDGVTVNYDTDLAIHLRSLPKQTSVYDAAAMEQARNTFEYDNYTGATHHYPLIPRSSITGLDPAFTEMKKTRGNLTMTTSSLLTNGVVTGSIYTYQQYDVAGNVVKAIDDLGNDTELDFSDHFGTPDGNAQLNSSQPELGVLQTYAFPWKVTNAMNHTVFTQRDYYTGAVVDAEDANGVTSSAYYGDLLDRPTKVIKAADELALKSQTSFSYDDILRIITTTSDFDVFADTTPLKSQMLYDGLGRTTETRQYETVSTYVTTKQTYDPLGRVEKVSNPYRSGDTVLWTTTTFDVLGRVTSVKSPDNATVTTSYSGNTVTATDQALKDRQSTTDALGRLTQVVEDPGTGGLGYVTTYAYDVLANLKTVTQGVQTRTFTYDSLSRLKTAFNPESGTVSYVYDDNGNLTQKTDARSITTTFTYDAINRPTLKNYSDTTPDVAYFYDGQTLPAGAPSFVRGSSTGRLVAVTTGGTSAGTYRGYDAMGQVVRQYQRTDAVNYLVEATYNTAGAMLTEKYPAVPGAGDRRTVSYASDAAGRLASLSSLATSYAPAASVTSVSYAPHGALASETLGNNLIHAQTYNNRLQPTAIKLGTAASPTSVVNLTYNYGTTTNNGNVQSVSYAGGGLSYTQTFGYDQLNRLTTSLEGASWSQTNSYDRYGNRAIVGSGMTFNPNNNRITNAGYTYDLVGNLLSDGAHAYTYDAENKVSKVDTVSAYVYDGAGQRVRKLVNENLRFIYDMGGKQIAEFSGANGTLKKEYIYGASGLVATIEPTAVNANGTRYTTSDHLGSPRVVTSSGAAVVSRHDYKPFGEELGSGIGGRTPAMGYGVLDGLRQKFTSKERDNETGLDYFTSRYYSSVQGRFTSADSILGRRANPQSLNRYSYVVNNPLKFVDPLGYQAEEPDDRKRGKKGLADDEEFGNTEDTPQIERIETLEPAKKKGSNSFFDFPAFTGPFNPFCTTGRCQGSSLRQLRTTAEGHLRQTLTNYRNQLPDAPDGLQLNLNALWVFSVDFTVTQDGEVFAGFDAGGWADAIRSGVASRNTGRTGGLAGGSLTAVYITDPVVHANGPDAPDIRHNFFSGLAWSATAGYGQPVGPAVGYIRSNNRNGIAVGVGTTGVNAGPSLSKHWFNLPQLRVPQ